MTESQRKAMEHAIEALTKSVQFCNHMGSGDWQPTAMACHAGIAACHGGIAALRAALKEDNEVSFDKAEPAVEPAAEIYAPSYLPRAIDLRFTHYGTTLPAGTKLYAAPVREPAPVPLLTDDEINGCFDVAFKTYRYSQSQVRGQQLGPSDDPDWHLAKAVEDLVRQKAGL